MGWDLMRSCWHGDAAPFVTYLLLWSRCWSRDRSRRLCLLQRSRDVANRRDNPEHPHQNDGSRDDVDTSALHKFNTLLTSTARDEDNRQADNNDATNDPADLLEVIHNIVADLI